VTIQAKIAAQISAAMIANISDRILRAYDCSCVFNAWSRQCRCQILDPLVHRSAFPMRP
jgi:hypothetical protein